MAIDNTINGKTPEEIKRGLECCSPRYESKHWVSCSSECPFRNEGVYCRNVLHAYSKKYIQLLEDGIDRVYKQVDALRGLPEKIQQLERERDAAIKDMAQTAVYLCCACKKYHHNDPGKDNRRCEMFENSEGFERVIACDMFEWRGTQEEV